MDKEQLDILDKIEKLIKENEELKEENKRLRICKDARADDEYLQILLDDILSLDKIKNVQFGQKIIRSDEFVNGIRRDKVQRVYIVDAGEYLDEKVVNSYVTAKSREIKKEGN